MIPQLLVSVRDVHEAESALAGGTSIIDVKEPRAGALGQASMDVIAEVARLAASRKVPCSAAFGELKEWSRPSSGSSSGQVTLDYAKLGLAGASVGQLASQWADAIRRIEDSCLAGAIRWIAVIYADWKSANAPDPRAVFSASDVLRDRYGIKIAGVLVDSFSKTSGRLMVLMSVPELQWICQESRKSGRFLALAGRVTVADLPELSRVGPDIVAVRSAVCSQSDRLNAVSRQAVAEFKAAMFRQFSEPEASNHGRAAVAAAKLR